MQRTAVIVSVATVLGVAFIFLMFGKADAPELVPVGETPEAWACDGDAKICPDGSAVGRTGPNCEFAACPMPPIVDPICEPGYELVGEGCIPAKDACELGGDQYYYDETQKKCLQR